jgi:integrase
MQLDRLRGSAYGQHMKRQDGYLTRKSGSWLGHYSKWITDSSTGQRTRQQKSFKIGPLSMTKTQARNRLRERIVSEIGITADSRVTLGHFLENRWKPLHEGNWRDSTKAVNAEHLKYIINRFGKTPIEDLDSVQMQQWLAELAKTKSGSLVRHCHIFLRSILAQATEEEYLRKNPARLLRVPKVKAVKKTYLSLPEIKALLEAAKWQTRDLALLQFVLVTALRPSELFALKWKCIDFKEGTMTLHESVYRGKIRPYTKTSEEGELPRLVIPESARVTLQEWYRDCDEFTPGKKYLGDEDFIFPNADGGFLRKENYSKRVLKELAERADVKPKIKKLNFQVLRRTVATHAQDLGSLKSIQTIMRHKQAQTTSQFYIQTIDASVRATGELLAAKMLNK